MLRVTIMRHAYPRAARVTLTAARFLRDVVQQNAVTAAPSIFVRCSGW
jgi:hypothetical protein